MFEKQLLMYLYVGLQLKMRNQIITHDPKDLMRVEEIAQDMKDRMKDSTQGSVNSYRHNCSNFRYSRVENSKEISASSNLDSNVWRDSLNTKSDHKNKRSTLRVQQIGEQETFPTRNTLQ